MQSLFGDSPNFQIRNIGTFFKVIVCSNMMQCLGQWLRYVHLHIPHHHELFAHEINWFAQAKSIVAYQRLEF